MSDLASKKCVPCEGNIPPFNADEIHQYLGNRPKMYPGIIGGHCVIPNLDLMQNQTLDFIKKLNKKYVDKVKTRK